MGELADFLARVDAAISAGLGGATGWPRDGGAVAVAKLAAVLAGVVGLLAAIRALHGKEGRGAGAGRYAAFAGLFALVAAPVLVALNTQPALRGFYGDNPLVAVGLAASLIALAGTPFAFAVMENRQYFEARRGRLLMRPAFASVAVMMMLVMGVPAIFAAMVIKSQSFDKDRYEFDPNKTWSVLEQGRGLASVQEADKQVKAEMARLAEERKNLVNTVKKLDEAMLRLRAVAGTSAAVSQAVPPVLQSLADVRRSVGVDGPQQLMDFTAPPVDLAALPAAPAGMMMAAAPGVAPAAAPAAAPGSVTKAEADAEVAAVPEPQKPLAKLLPLVDVEKGWAVGKSGPKHLETFNAANLFEKMDGGAEAYIQYHVVGMAYAFYHPAGDEANEAQLYIFEMASALDALGKYGSDKPAGVAPLPIGAEGYSAAGSTFFHQGPYYVMITSSVSDDPRFNAFTVDLAKKVAAAMPKDTSVGPDAVFALLPATPGRADPKYVPQDVFGYSFLSDVFTADYADGPVTWQGFLRPYPDAAAARAVFDQYLAGAKQDGAKVTLIEAEGADAMVVSSNIGLVDAFFLKGNALGGGNGATDAAKVEAFARAFAKSLPKSVPVVEIGTKEKAKDYGGDAEK